MGYNKPTYGAVKLEPLHKNAIVPYGETRKNISFYFLFWVFRRKVLQQWADSIQN
jgi:hypothetical protein